MKTVEELDTIRKQFELSELFLNFTKSLDVYYTNLGGYHYSDDNKCSFYLNGALKMYEELRK